MRNIIDKKNKNHVKSEDGLYAIPCTNCYKNYIGETSTSIKNVLMNTSEILKSVMNET